MIEKQAYEKEKEDIKKTYSNKKLIIDNLSFVDTGTKLLFLFSSDFSKKNLDRKTTRITESELIGSLTAFISSFANDINVTTQYVIPTDSGQKDYRPDLLLQKDKEKLIIEIKMVTQTENRLLNSGSEQLLHYLTPSGITNGILYIPPSKNNEKLEIKKTNREIANKFYQLIQIYSKNI